MTNRIIRGLILAQIHELLFGYLNLSHIILILESINEDGCVFIIPCEEIYLDLK